MTEQNNQFNQIEQELQQELQRVIPVDLSDASVRTQLGEYVDVSSLIPIAEKEKGHESVSGRNMIQMMFNEIAETVNSSKYAEFQRQITEELVNVTGQDFLFDIEGIFMNQISANREKIYYVYPYMSAVIIALLKNGNNVAFWTSATNEMLEKMRKAMIPELAARPAIGREDWGKVVGAYRSHFLGQLDDGKTLQVVQSVYPSATTETYQTGLPIFNKYMFEAFDANPTSILRGTKFPQIFLSSRNGFFVDDNEKFIDGAIRRGWPSQRAIKCEYSGGEKSAKAVAQQISTAVNSSL